MAGELGTALAQVAQAFAAYPRRAVLEGCPHCRGSVPVHEHDLYSLTISLGSTVGDRHDVKSLLPLLLERLVTSAELDPDIVLGKLAYEQWRTWPAVEQQAVDRYLAAVWRSVLAEFPSRIGAFPDAATFLTAATRAGEHVDRFLTTWHDIPGPAADRHLAQLVNDLDFSARRGGPLITWVRRDPVRRRLLAAFERDLDEPWADDLARAYDLVR